MTIATVPLDVACQWGIVSSDLSISTLQQLLPRLKDAGYTRIVLPRVDSSRPDLRELAAVLRDHAVTPLGMAGVAAGADVGSPDPAERERGRRMLRAALDTLVILGGDQLNGVPYGVYGAPVGLPPQGAFERAARVVGTLADEAHDRGVLLTFEVLNRYETSLLNTARQAVDFVHASGSAHLRMHLDSYHMAIEESEGIRAAVALAMPSLGYLELGQSGRGALDSGQIDIAAVVADALDDGYEGRWGIEAFTRSALAVPVADRLAIWREPYADGLALAEDAHRVIRRGWNESAVGRRARRLERVGPSAPAHG
jgi:D-psicose/D-tagatose/L-ribulose 3-epimerase